MKKYLVKGALALFGGAFLFSCAEKESEYVPLAQQKVQAFDEVFKEVFGDNIDPYQDWGFNSAALKLDPNDSSMVMEVIDISEGESAGTRMPAFAGTRSGRTRTGAAEPRGNEWFKEYNVPYALTYAQKDLVRKYFQQVKDPGGPAPDWSTFFVQQVYKGGTNVTSDSKTTEAYYSAYGNPNSPFYGSNQMDQLSCANKEKNGNVHISNYNNASCSGNSNIKHAGVYKDGYTPWTQDNYDVNKGWENCVNENNNNLKEFTDTIMLMVDCSTSYFGYKNSLQSGYVYNDMFRCVNGNVIMQWAKDHNITVPSDGNVSGMYFVGFDYESDLKHNLNDINQGNSYLVTEVPEGTEGAFQIPNKQNDGDWQKGKWFIDGARDHYYSDWIVRIVPGNDVPPIPRDVPHTTVVEYWTPLEAGRVFCEDLGRASREDLDYNDLVFDARTWKYEKYTINWTWHYNDASDANPATKTKGDSTLTETQNYADIKLLAAGGTIPITIVGRQVHSLFKKPADIATMINTRDNNSNVYGSFDVRSAIEVGDKTKGDEQKTFKTKDGDSFTLWLIPGYEHIKDIPIVSSFDGAQVTELNANQGQAPHKILVEYGTTKWVSERKNLALAYPNFSNYVTGQINKTGWVKEGINTNYLYDQPVENEYSPAPTIIKSTKEIVGDSELEIWSGTKAFGSNWNYASTSSDHDYYSNKEFFPGDRIRFHGRVTATGDADQPYITVSFVDDSKPYLVDTQFAERKKRTVNGKDEWYYPTTAYVEILLDEFFCSKLNNSKNDAGQLTLHVQGRGFTLTKIGYVPFQ
jgi:hypothetical protein